MEMAAPMQVAVAVASMPVTMANHAAMPVVTMMVVPVPSRVSQLEFSARSADRWRRLCRKRRRRRWSDEGGRHEGNCTNRQLDHHFCSPFLDVGFQPSDLIVD